VEELYGANNPITIEAKKKANERLKELSKKIIKF